MKQNSSTEPLSYSFNKVCSKNDPPTHPRPQIQIFPRIPRFPTESRPFSKEMVTKSKTSKLESEVFYDCEGYSGVCYCRIDPDDISELPGAPWNLISDRKSREIREEMRFGGLGGPGAILTVSGMKRIARKLRRIILLHFRLITFRFYHRRIQKPRFP